VTGSRRRGPRRADAPGTGPATADGPEPRLPGQDTDPASGPAQGGAVVGKDRRTGPTGRRPAEPREPIDPLGRWLLEQRPPHWG